MVGKVRTLHRAMDQSVDLMKQDGIDENWEIIVAHVDSEAEGHVLQDKLKAAFPDAHHTLIPLVSVVSAHTGLGCQAIQYFKRYGK